MWSRRCRQSRCRPKQIASKTRRRTARSSSPRAVRMHSSPAAVSRTSTCRRSAHVSRRRSTQPSASSARTMRETTGALTPSVRRRSLWRIGYRWGPRRGPPQSADIMSKRAAVRPSEANGFRVTRKKPWNARLVPKAMAFMRARSPASPVPALMPPAGAVPVGPRRPLSASQIVSMITIRPPDGDRRARERRSCREVAGAVQGRPGVSVDIRACPARGQPGSWRPKPQRRRRRRPTTPTRDASSPRNRGLRTRGPRRAKPDGLRRDFSGTRSASPPLAPPPRPEGARPRPDAAAGPGRARPPHAAAQAAPEVGARRGRVVVVVAAVAARPVVGARPAAAARAAPHAAPPVLAHAEVPSSWRAAAVARVPLPAGARGRRVPNGRAPPGRGRRGRHDAARDAVLLLERRELVGRGVPPLARGEPLGRDAGERGARQAHHAKARGVAHAPDLLVAPLGDRELEPGLAVFVAQELHLRRQRLAVVEPHPAPPAVEVAGPHLPLHLDDVRLGD